MGSCISVPSALKRTSIVANNQMVMVVVSIYIAIYNIVYDTYTYITLDWEPHGGTATDMWLPACLY